MAQYFYIKKGSTLNSLRMELIDDGKYDFFKNQHFNNAIQNADITFSMIGEDGVLKVSKAPCNIVLSNEGCSEKYILEYKWQKRDVNKPGQYKAWFEITFKDDIYEYGSSYDSGNLIIPIYEELVVFVKD